MFERSFDPVLIAAVCAFSVRLMELKAMLSGVEEFESPLS